MKERRLKSIYTAIPHSTHILLAGSMGSIIQTRALTIELRKRNHNTTTKRHITTQKHVEQQININTSSFIHLLQFSFLTLNSFFIQCCFFFFLPFSFSSFVHLRCCKNLVIAGFFSLSVCYICWRVVCVSLLCAWIVHIVYVRDFVNCANKTLRDQIHWLTLASTLELGKLQHEKRKLTNRNEWKQKTLKLNTTHTTTTNPNNEKNNN